MQPAIVNCPVCGGESVSSHAVGDQAIRAGLAEALHIDVPPSLDFPAYDIRECTQCSLSFSDPMLPGDQPFYDWITSREGYTGKLRWEWGVMLELLRHRHQSTTLLELGCGVGLFLERAEKLSNVSTVGIDGSAAAIAQAAAKGLTVRQEMAEDTIRRGETFDIVVLSHILEHVADPAALMQQVKTVLKPAGSVMCSVPYSPMSREYPALGIWDPMNLPPHHLTRWNARSFRALADRMGMTVQLYSPKPKSAWKRALQLNAAAAGGRPNLLGRLLAAAKEPSSFAAIFRTLQARDRINGRRAGDVVLAVFS